MTTPSTPLRADGRTANELREVRITTGCNPYAEGSCLIQFGRTEVICTASVQTKVPQWLKGKGQGWLTAEYGMLPRATGERKDREATRGKQDGRTVEIQRLIGRSLRSICTLSDMDGLTLWLDCDVLVADGGTRTAAITGSYIAAALALRECASKKLLRGPVLREPVAAISCGLTDTGVILDMDYAEDSQTHADANFVMSASGDWIEVQVSAEQRPVKDAEIALMKDYAAQGIRQLIDLQQQALAMSA
ncbi:MAG: ribonuclease PH [Blastochloris viridis]|uniref:Ribonuclease PH n=1 Tax=Blastochloris viridis TaxID=1079 RepID=A0A6N4RA16_BLAVI|nr:MAG: ribonuclease PH [Blastochloris viridis]